MTGQRNNSECEIEITPEMVRVGVRLLHESGRLRHEVLVHDALLVEKMLKAALAQRKVASRT